MSAEEIRQATRRFPHDLRPGTTVRGGIVGEHSCQKTDGSALRVWARKGNRSAFNGYHWTPSDYSEVVCDPGHGGCGGRVRTKARYVDLLPDSA